MDLKVQARWVSAIGTEKITRRDLLKAATVRGGGVAVAGLIPFSMQQAPANSLAAMRARMAARPIQATPLTNIMTMFSGPGGNVVVFHGADGKVVVDTFVQGVFADFKPRVDALAPVPLLFAVNTHWHFDHTDNNESFSKAGAKVIAHENTRRRLSQPHDMAGIHLSPVRPAALPAETFKHTHQLRLNYEYIEMGYFEPAHTDTDIYVQFILSEVLHLGDTFFNGMYPFIDVSTGGAIKGMIAAADKALEMVTVRTKIVPGHGTLGDRASLIQYRDMLVTVHDRVVKLKTEGRAEMEVVAAKPTADLDSTWGKGIVSPDAFVATVYNTL